MSFDASYPWRPIPGAGQNLTIGAASVASTAVGTQTYAVSVSATGNCHVAVGVAPVALATSLLVKATDPPRLLRVLPGEKVAVIQDAASTGTLNVHEMSH
ncbi:MAG: hypothetical protein KGI52_18125 [Burkholderiales bacterium]|nr:hypothetical protein [Burkholderiales bacterium]